MSGPVPRPVRKPPPLPPVSGGAAIENRRIETEADVAAALAALLDLDPRLAEVHRIAGHVPLRRVPAGRAGLFRIVVGQQLSVASAAAVWGRLEPLVAPLADHEIAALPDAALRGVGLSAAKVRTVRAIASALADGLDLHGLADVSADASMVRLTAIPGVGPWTAELYLMFAVGHPDIFPCGDLALRRAVACALADDGTDLAPAEVAGLAEAWRPHRSTAARLMWSYYRARRGQAATPV